MFAFDLCLRLSPFVSLCPSWSRCVSLVSLYVALNRLFFAAALLLLMLVSLHVCLLSCLPLLLLVSLCLPSSLFVSLCHDLVHAVEDPYV